MGRPKKKIEDALSETMSGVLSDIGSSMKAAAQEAAGSNDPSTQILKRLQSQYGKATLKIKRRTRTGADALFSTLEGQDLKEVEDKGLDTLCAEEGGSGVYHVEIKPIGGDHVVFGPFHISGRAPRTIPLSQEIDGSNPDAPMSFPSGFGTPLAGFSSGIPAMGKVPTQPQDNTVKEVISMMKEHSDGQNSAQSQSTDKMLAMMMQYQGQIQSQQQNSQQQMVALLSGMFASRNQEPQENQEVKALRDKLERMEQRRLEDERFRAQERQIEELKAAINAQKLENQRPQSTGMEWIVPLITAQQSSAANQSSQMLELVKMINEKPGDDEKMSNIFSTLTMSNQTTMNMIMEIARSGLLGGGDDHPIRDAVLQGLDMLKQLGEVALTSKMAQPAPHSAQVVRDSMPPIIASEPFGALEAHEPEEEEEDEDEEYEEVLSVEELDRIDRDSALQKVVACLFNGEHVSEATARLYGHAMSGNTVALKWLEEPEAVTRQVFEAFGVLERRPTVTLDDHSKMPLDKALIENIYAFADYLEAEKDPNAWAKTGYKPIRRPKPPEIRIDEEPSTETEVEHEAPTTTANGDSA